MGIIVEYDGSIPGSAFVITPSTGDQQSAVVSYDTVNDRYMVVYMDFFASPTESDLYGRLVAFDGGLIGGEFVVNDDAGNQDFPAITFNSDYGDFLVVWEDDYLGDWDVTAQEVLATGALPGGPFIVSPDYSDQNNAAVTYNDYWGEYIVIWEDTRRGSLDIYGQALTGYASFLGYNTRINDDAVTSAQPAICACDSCGEYLGVWSALYGGDYDVLGQILY
jgi:hypothetical protein